MYVNRARQRQRNRNFIVQEISIVQKPSQHTRNTKLQQTSICGQSLNQSIDQFSRPGGFFATQGCTLLQFGHFTATFFVARQV